MKDMGRMLLQKEAFEEIAIGNTAIARAIIESGVRVVTSYPGSPTPEIAEALKAIPKEDRPFYFEFSTNEKVATEVAFGAAINGNLAVVFFKSVGLNVAADSFVQLSLMDITGGLVVILGDDPGANSSQNEQDNRHYCHLSYTPVLEPASAQEAYLMFKQAASLAAEFRTVVVLRLTTHVCHAKQKIKFDARVSGMDWKPETAVPLFNPEASNYIPIAATVFPLKRRALERLRKIEDRISPLKLDLVINNNNKRRGIIVAGLPFASVMDVIADLGNKPDILKLGCVYPLDRKLILKFLSAHDEVKILEELDPILEKEIKSLAYDNALKTCILGKSTIDELMGEYTPGKVAGILRDTWADLFPKATGASARQDILKPRPPQMCPGCGHRSAFYAIKKALRPEDISVADIGCHTLGYLPPLSMGKVLLSMGHSVSTASGLALHNSARRVICFMGDSTFFHAGLPGIANAVYNCHDVVLVVMENGTTAMTGHQDHPGVGRNFNGDTGKISVRAALEGLGVTNIREVDAYKQAELTAMTTAALAEKGFKVIIAKHPCMLKLTREARRKPGWTARRVKVDGQTCTRLHECVERFACPSFQRGIDGGVTVSHELCIGDGSCRQTCESEAIVPDSRDGGAK